MIRPLTLAMLLALAAPPVAAKQAPAPDIKAALADPARPAADREREAAMKRFYGHHQYEPQELDDHTGRLARDAEIQKQMDERDGRER